MADEVQHKVPKGENNSEQADESTNLVAPVYSTNTSYSVNENAKKNLATVGGENRGRHFFSELQILLDQTKLTRNKQSPDPNYMRILSIPHYLPSHSNSKS